MSNTEIVVALQKQVEQAKLQRAKALAELERCETDLDNARQLLKDQFEVDTPQDAAYLLKKLTHAFDVELESIVEGLRDLES